MKQTENKSQKTDIEKIDDPFMDAFRDLLKRYIEELSTDITEIAAGLSLSRPVVTDFMIRKKGRNHLPLSPGRICNLHSELTKPENLQVKRRLSHNKQSIKETRTKSQEARSRLKEDGADELLMAAGFQPKKLKMVPVSSPQYSQMSFISFLYENRPLSQDLYSQITQREMDRMEIERGQQDRELIKDIKENKSIGAQKKQADLDEKIDTLSGENNYLTDKLIRTSWINQEVRSEVKSKYNRAIKSIDKREQDLTSTEKAGLFKSVLNNQLSKNEEFDLGLRVIRIDRIPLSLPWTKENLNTDASEFLSQLREIGNSCERKFSKLSSEDNFNTNQSENQYLLKSEHNSRYPIYPVVRTIVTCKGKDNQEIKFECIARGTDVSNTISAIAQNMGFRHSIKDLRMDMTWLGKDVRSLISTVVTIGNNYLGETVSGEWVSSDLLQSLLQATIIAGNRWFYKNFSSSTNNISYISIIKLSAELRASFYKCRLAFDEYDFDGSIVDIDKFRMIGEEAKTHIKSLESEVDSGMWITFLHNFSRIHALSQLYRLRHYNIQANYDLCHKLIGDIQSILSEEGNKTPLSNSFSIPFQIALSVEKIAYNISFGIPYHNNSSTQLIKNLIDNELEHNLLEVDNIFEHIDSMNKIIEKKIKEYIQSDGYHNDLGYDMHHSLASYYSIVGRLLFYVGKEKKDLEAAFENFLKAAYYFQRIGLSRKVQRSLALAGRAKIRTKEEIYVKQSEELSKFLLQEYINKLDVFSDQKLFLSMSSRLNLLRGEYSLIIKEDREKSLIYCLESLKGALWLGLNRHIVDILYTISQCVKNLNDRRVKDDLEKIFPEFWKESGEITGKNIDDLYRILIRSKKDNKIAKEVVKGLFDRRDLINGTACWGDLEQDLINLSASIWNGWYWKALKKKEGEHPFAMKIKSLEFLKPIN
jgi:hypothetical protein